MANFNELMQRFVNESYDSLLTLANSAFADLSEHLKKFFHNAPDYSAQSILLLTATCLGADGKLTAIGYGNVTVTVTCGKFEATCLITVNEIPDPDAGITLESEELTLNEGDTALVGATFIPVFDADDTTLTYTVSDEAVILVDSEGNITAIAPGVATVIVENADKTFTVTLTVTVNELPNPNAGITLESEELTLNEGETAPVGATFIPVFNADDTTLTYTVSDETVILVDSEGNVIALAPGVATVTVENADKTFTATLTVIVNELPNPNAGITLSVANEVLYPSDTTTVTATVIPVYVSDDTTVTFTSSDSEIFTVDENGLITAISAGTATLTATCGELSATIELTIHQTLIVGEDTETGYGEFIPYS